MTVNAKSGLAAIVVLSVLGPAAEAADVKYPEDAPLVWPASVTRKSASKDRDGWFHPPWSSATVGTVVPRPVKVGDVATVVPVRSGMPARQLKVTAVIEQPAIGDELPATWVVDLDASSEDFFAARPDRNHSDDMPFDAVAIFPAVPKARLVSGSAARDWPKAPGCSVGTLWAAVDLQSDGKADVAIYRFCCESPKSAWTGRGGACDQGCERIYLRRQGGPWRLVEDEVED